MIERKFVAQRIKEFQIQEYIEDNLKRVGHSHTKMQRTPLGDKIIIFASRPGLIVGRQGHNIKALTTTLKSKFNLENPQIEINEVEDINLDAQIIAERIANSLERFGPQKFKAIGHKTMKDVMSAGALGIEVILSGKIPSARAKSWRFYQGYLKKCGDVAVTQVRKAQVSALLKTGIIGIKVSIMPPDIKLPDRIEFITEPKQDSVKKEGEVPKEEKKEVTAEEKKESKTEEKETKAKDKAEKESKAPRKSSKKDKK